MRLAETREQIRERVRRQEKKLDSIAVRIRICYADEMLPDRTDYAAAYATVDRHVFDLLRNGCMSGQFIEVDPYDVGGKRFLAIDRIIEFEVIEND